MWTFKYAISNYRFNLRRQLLLIKSDLNQTLIYFSNFLANYFSSHKFFIEQLLFNHNEASFVILVRTNHFIWSFVLSFIGHSGRSHCCFSKLNWLRHLALCYKFLFNWHYFLFSFHSIYLRDFQTSPNFWNLFRSFVLSFIDRSHRSRRLCSQL